jgi:hypothetical protein
MRPGALVGPQLRRARPGARCKPRPRPKEVARPERRVVVDTIWLLGGCCSQKPHPRKPTPSVAAYAALIASVCGFPGARLVECRWLNVLDRPAEDRLALLGQAEGLGLARVRSAGDVLEIDVRSPMANTLRVQEIVNR